MLLLFVDFASGLFQLVGGAGSVPPLVKVNVPRTVPSGASSNAWASLGGILVIQAGLPTDEASILPYVAADTAAPLPAGVGDVARPAPPALPFVGASGLADMVVVVVVVVVLGCGGSWAVRLRCGGLREILYSVGRVLAFALLLA